MSTATSCRIQAVADLSPEPATNSTVSVTVDLAMSPIYRRFRQQSTLSPVCTGLNWFHLSIPILFDVTAPCPIIGDNRLPRFSSTQADVYRPHLDHSRTLPRHRVSRSSYCIVLYVLYLLLKIGRCDRRISSIRGTVYETTYSTSNIQISNT